MIVAVRARPYGKDALQELALPGRGPDLSFNRADRHALVEVAEGARPHRGADGGAALID